MTTCPDCGGPLTQAFPTTTNYDRCRRCGHVFPAATPPECSHEFGISDEGRCYDCDRRVGWGRLVLIEAGLVTS